MQHTQQRFGIGRVWLIATTLLCACLTPTHAQEKATTASQEKASTPFQAPNLPDPSQIPIPKEDDAEVRLGRENAEEHDKEAKLLNDPVLIERVNRIGQEIANVANRLPVPALWGRQQMKQFKYTFKVVDNKDVNAYCMPGGFIYVNKGLLDIVRSDHELAGVLAHEISHAAHHHILKLLREQDKIQRALLPVQLIALLAAAFSGGGASIDAINIWQATQLYSIAKTNTYGVAAEKDADYTAIQFLLKTRYNPVGVYSFMIRLASLEKRQLAFDLGIFRTHPPGEERVAAAKQALQDLKISLNLSEVDPTLKATAALLPLDKTGIEFAEVRASTVAVCKVVALDGMNAEERAQKLARRLTALFDSGLSPLDIQFNRDRTRVLVRGVVALSDEDARSQGVPLETLLRDLKEAIVQVRQKRQIEFTQ